MAGFFLAASQTCRRITMNDRKINKPGHIIKLSEEIKFATQK
jgi:hypothetical protein